MKICRVIGEEHHRTNREDCLKCPPGISRGCPIKHLLEKTSYLESDIKNLNGYIDDLEAQIEDLKKELTGLRSRAPYE